MRKIKFGKSFASIFTSKWNIRYGGLNFKSSFNFSRSLNKEKLSKPGVLLTINDEYQAYIEQAPSFNALNDLWDENKEGYNTINKCTFLNRMINLYPMKKENLRHNPVIKEIIASLEDSIQEMNTYSHANFISNISRINIDNPQLFEKILDSIEQKKSTINITSCSYILWSMAKRGIKRPEIIEHIAKCLLKQRNEEIEEENVCNIFWSLATLNYRNSDIVEILEKSIKKSCQKYKFPSINLIFGGYSKLRYPNEPILDSMVIRITRIAHNTSLRNIANLLLYCEKLNYKNDFLLDTLEMQLIKKLEPIMNELHKEIAEEKENPEIQEELEEFTEKKEIEMRNEDEEISVQDICKIMTSFVRLKRVKPQLFELLEGIFMKKIYEASPESLALMAFCHSNLSNELVLKYHENKKEYLKRSLKKIKNQNHLFYEIVMPFVKIKLEDFTPKQILSFFISASRPQVTKRAICRELVDIGTSAMEKIDFFDPNFGIQHFHHQYYKTLIKFAINENEKLKIDRKFEETKISITQLEQKFGYLLPDSNFSLFDDN